MPQGQIAPDPWGQAMEDAGLTSPRTGKASMRALAEVSGIHPTTVNRVIYGNMGRRGVTPATIEALAQALKKKPAVVAEWVGQEWATNVSGWTPPDEIKLLSRRDLKVVEDMIRTLAESRKTVSVEVEKQVQQRMAASGKRKIFP